MWKKGGFFFPFPLHCQLGARGEAAISAGGWHGLVFPSVHQHVVPFEVSHILGVEDCIPVEKRPSQLSCAVDEPSSDLCLWSSRIERRSRAREDEAAQTVLHPTLCEVRLYSSPGQRAGIRYACSCTIKTSEYIKVHAANTLTVWAMLHLPQPEFFKEMQHTDN